MMIYLMSLLKNGIKEEFMNKEEVTILGFEIVSYSGEARSYYLEAIKYAKNNEYDKAYELLELAEKV